MKTKTENLFLVPALIAVLSLLPAGRATAQITITVSSTADSGAGTLRAALASAANGDTIDASGVTGTILLTSGELLVTNSVTILGPGPANLAVNGSAASRVFHIAPSNTVTIASLTITNGSADAGGGIYTGPGALTVSNCTLSGNSATNGRGGGIYNYGNAGSAPLTVSTSTLSGNSASVSGGGIYNNGSSGSAPLTVSHSTLTGNSAHFGGGIYNNGYNGSAPLTVSSSILSSNSASSGSGGGIYNNGESSSTGTVQIANSTLSGNSASGSGGGIFNDGTSSGKAALTVSNSTLTSNSAQFGGGVENSGYGGSATLQVVTSTLSGNSASVSGGGIYNNGSSGSAPLTVSHSTLTGNSAQFGGGIYNDGRTGSAPLTVSSSTLSGNSASSGSGGGIYNNGESSGAGTVQVANSTLSGNSARYGGGIYNDGTSFGKATLTVSSSTLSGNLASVNGGGIYNNGNGGNASLEIGSTILNAGAFGANIFNYFGTVSSDGYNLASDDGGGFLTGTADQINTDPMLGLLQDNGGPTFTHALLPGSPAIDKGTNFTASATDQRGTQRPYDYSSVANASGGDGSDIGAFELNPPQLSIARTANNVVLTWSIHDTGFTLQSTTNLVPPLAWNTNSPSPVVIAGQNTVTNPISGPQQFYRLVQ